nr:hypothetical protein [uncultured Pseudomonas sp.]
MNIVADNDFGELHFDGVWRGGYEVELFGERSRVELIVQTFDDDPISENQRLAFREFESNKESICSMVEQAVLSYYCDRVDEYRDCFDADEVDAKAPRVDTVDGLRNLVFLRRIKVMSAFDAREHQIGFIFDTTFDAQLGLGVLVTNGVVEAVDTQDILLG